MVLTAVGVAVTLLGIALIVLPGPAFLVLPLGLVVLASEHDGVARLLHSGLVRWPTAPEPLQGLRRKLAARLGL